MKPFAKATAKGEDGARVDCYRIEVTMRFGSMGQAAAKFECGGTNLYAIIFRDIIGSLQDRL